MPDVNLLLFVLVGLGVRSQITKFETKAGLIVKTEKHSNLLSPYTVLAGGGAINLASKKIAIDR